MSKSLLIIPTYNERKNIETLLIDLKAMYPDLHVLIVDDNSQDGTADYIKERMKNDPNLFIIEREGKLGLGTAYVCGFKHALKKGYDFILQMDADYSHDPKEIEVFLKLGKKYDLVIGSRYVQGVNVVNWPMKRLLLSYFANVYSRIVTGLPIKDGTGGFKLWRKEVLESIDLDRIHSNGYGFQIEMNYKAWKNGFKIKESPIIFTDRVEGTSKMSKKIIYEAIFLVWKLRFGLTELEKSK